VTGVASFDEVRAVLAGVVADVTGAQECAAQARARLDEALALLTELGTAHAEPLPPPALVRAVDELDRGLGLIAAGAEAVAGIGARL
jgi:hypothetical protein